MERTPNAGIAKRNFILQQGLEEPTPAHDLGMTTTLVVPRTIDPFRDAIEQEAVEAPHIDHITSDLAGFLKGSAPGRSWPESRRDHEA